MVMNHHNPRWDFPHPLESGATGDMMDVATRWRAWTVSSVPGFSDSKVVVWDPLVQAFHRSQVARFAVAYLSGEGEMLVLHA